MFMLQICDPLSCFYQWLVKMAIETREEMGDYVRAYSICQFQKTHKFPEVDSFLICIFLTKLHQKFYSFRTVFPNQGAV